MPVFKKHTFSYRNQETDEVIQLTTTVNINAAGMFYVHLSDDMAAFAEGVPVMHGKRTLMRQTFAELESALHSIMHNMATPQQEESLVILYRFDLNCCFALQGDTVVPNGFWEGAKWPPKGSTFGDIGLNQRLRGFSIGLAAGAFRKTVLKFGKSQKVKYERYDGPDDDHHDTEHPAPRLNHWLMRIDEKSCKEIPYSDEAAVFFYRAIEGLCNLAVSIDRRFGTEERLVEQIESQAPLLLQITP